MSNRGKRIDAKKQGSLFDLLKQTFDQERLFSGPGAGSLNMAHRLRGALNQALKDAADSRELVAGRMSELTGTTITKAQIDAWTAEAKPHRMPAEYLPAFCVATGSNDPLRILGEAAGVFVLRGPDAIRAEIQQLTEKDKKVKAEIRKRELFLKEMEGKLR